MSWSNRDKQVWEGIQNWKQELYSYEANDIENTYVKWLDYAFSSIPGHLQEKFFTRLDGWLFHLHSLIQGSQMQKDARERILVTARAFSKEMESIEDLQQLTIDQLHYIAEQHAGRHRIYSLCQGGITGTGGAIALGTDLPALTVINLRSVQLIALTYGYNVQTPFEMMTSLKVFHAATMPARLRSYAWEELIGDIEKKESEFFYDGSDHLSDNTWLEGPLKHCLKGVAITMFKGKKLSKIPLLSMAIGAGVNYQFSRKVTEFAEKFYQYRYLKEKRHR